MGCCCFLIGRFGELLALHIWRVRNQTFRPSPQPHAPSQQRRLVLLVQVRVPATHAYRLLPATRDAPSCSLVDRPASPPANTRSNTVTSTSGASGGKSLQARAALLPPPAPSAASSLPPAPAGSPVAGTGCPAEQCQIRSPCCHQHRAHQIDSASTAALSQASHACSPSSSAPAHLAVVTSTTTHPVQPTRPLTPASSDVCVCWHRVQGNQHRGWQWRQAPHARPLQQGLNAQHPHASPLCQHAPLFSRMWRGSFDLVIVLAACSWLQLSIYNGCLVSLTWPLSPVTAARFGCQVLVACGATSLNSVSAMAESS